MQLIDSIHEALQRNLLQASDARVAEEGQGDARGSGLNAALINPPETFWRRSPRPQGSFGRPPTPPPWSPLARPRGDATLPATLQKLKGCIYLFLKKFEGLQVGLRRPSWAPKGLESFPFPSGKGAWIWPLAQARRNLVSALCPKAPRLRYLSPFASTKKPPSYAPKGSRLAPFPTSHMA